MIPSISHGALLGVLTIGTAWCAPTFHEQVAPILHHHCAECHRPEQSAPFSLLTFSDAKKHAADIAQVTRTGFMPPWLPERGGHKFDGERGLSKADLQTIQDWVAAGAPEGEPAKAPPLPVFDSRWQLGEPDLIVHLPQPYTLGASGPDLYRNFVIPSPVNETRYVRAFEFRPRNKSVHHVRIKLDTTRQARRLDEQDAEPGFAGMKTPGKFPQGHLITWVPGQRVAPVPEGLSWPLEPAADLVVQIHLQRSGKPESIQPELGLYFTNRPPARQAFLIGLGAELIDIAPGETNYWVERQFELPAPVELLGILPHLHYLGRTVEAFATLPGGKNETLLRIHDWDFNWQGDYRYRAPVPLPKGTILHMRYRYDNSTQNIRNPNHPPKRVVFGPQSTDEMAELWLQVLPRNPADLPLLHRADRATNDLETVAFYQHRLRTNPNDPDIHTALGKVLGPMGRLEEAVRHFQRAIELNPRQVEGHYYFALSLYTIREYDNAQRHFETVLQLDPKYEKAWNGLGLIAIQRNRPADAAGHFRKTLALNPDDPTARAHLQRLGR